MTPAVLLYCLATTMEPIHNNPDGMDYAAGFHEVQKALEIAKQNTPLISDWEMALIEAQLHCCWPVGSKSLNELDYANAMPVAYLAWSSGSWSTPLSSGTTVNLAMISVTTIVTHNR